MDYWIKLLGSLKVAVGLLLVLLAALAAGTMVESSQGTQEAWRLVYYAKWFQVLLIAIGANTAFAIAARWPPNKYRIGFLLTHTSLILILVGALASATLKIEGSLALWEGQQGDRFWLPDQEESLGPLGVLPFEVRLDSFEIDTYPGSMRPAMFRSRVTVVDAAAGAFPAVIEMNRELSWAGYQLFQSSYQQEGGREMTVLSVSRDPGQLIVFIGYGLLLAGMAVVIGTRAVQQKALTRRQEEWAAQKKGKRGKKVAAAAAGLLAVAAFAGAARAAAALPEPGTAAALASLPVQHDGRVMPLDTLAREAVWNVTGVKGRWQGLEPVDVVLAWTFYPQAWAAEPIVEVGSGELAVAAGLPRDTGHASFQQLLGAEPVRRLISEARQLQAAEQPMDGLHEDALALEERLTWLQGFFSRESLRVVPRGDDPQHRWDALSPAFQGAAVLAESFRREKAAPAAGWPPFEAIERELTYNRVRPSRLAWWVLVPATLLSLMALKRPEKPWYWATVATLLAGFAVMTWGIATRWQVAGRIPASNMYESMLFLGWGVGLFALVAALFLRQRLVFFNAAAMAALTMVLVDLLPVDPFIHPMAPVLSGTPWLAIHVPIIMVSYSVLALGVLIAHLQIGIEIFRPAKREAAARMNQLLYWYMHVGSWLLAAGIITGSVWAASSWGRYWGWDPKEVWSLIAFLAYMAILHARFDRQIQAFGVAAASIVAFWAVLMTYLGVNFVLSSGLHSYGFGSGGLVEWMAGIGLLEVVFLAAGWFAYRRNTAVHGPLVAAGI